MVKPWNPNFFVAEERGWKSEFLNSRGWWGRKSRWFVLFFFQSERKRWEDALVLALGSKFCWEIQGSLDDVLSVGKWTCVQTMQKRSMLDSSWFLFNENVAILDLTLPELLCLSRWIPPKWANMSVRRFQIGNQPRINRKRILCYKCHFVSPNWGIPKIYLDPGYLVKFEDWSLSMELNTWNPVITIDSAASY